MAERTPYKPYPYSTELPDTLAEYPDGVETDETGQDSEPYNSLFPLVSQQQQASNFYPYNNGHQHMPPSVSSPHSVKYQLVPEEDEDGESSSALLLTLPQPVPVPPNQVESTHDEFEYSSKRKCAKFIGPYLFGDVIGQGSYAKVKECLDRRNLCRRAVKIMQRRRLRRTPQGEKMAATEICILKKLNHPNIIKLYDFIRNDEKQKLYLFIDLCVVSLQEMLDANEQQPPSKKLSAFPTWQAHGYFVQLINGLEYLHSKFIIHNDIKPGNLLITVDHQLKITDFGTAEQLDMFSADDTLKRSQGTPAFQCPEIANGDEVYSGFCIDIWSCGVTLFNLVTGHLPFQADNIYLLFQTIGRGDFVIPNDIEPHLTSLLRGLLHLDKSQRFTIEQTKQHDWFRRRPPRTFDFLPFPYAALNRFQAFTMYEYLAELHQPSADNGDELLIPYEPDAADTSGNASTNERRSPMINHSQERDSRNEQPRQGNSVFSRLNCGCSRTISSDNIHQSKSRRRQQHRICSIS